MRPIKPGFTRVSSFKKRLRKFLDRKLDADVVIETPFFDNTVATGMIPKLTDLPSYGFIWQGLARPLGFLSRRTDSARLEFFLKASISDSGGPEGATEYLENLYEAIFEYMDANKQPLGILMINKLLSIPSVSPQDMGILQLRGEIDILIA